MGGGGRRAAVPGCLGVAFFLLLALLPLCNADIVHSSIKDDNRNNILFERFGFGSHGQVDVILNSLNVQTADKAPAASTHSMGFFLITEEARLQVLVDEEQNPNECPLDNRHVRPLFRLEDVAQVPFSYNASIEAHEYTLYFSNCQFNENYVSMEVTTEMYNLVNGVKSYLPAGQTQLPSLYFSFATIYVVLFVVWVYVCLKQKETAHSIHLLMGLLVVIKVLNLMFEAADKSYVEKTGTPHGWDIAYTISGFFRGVMLFIVIVLIGTGWSFLKPFLQDKEKKVLMVVIPLQVMANIANIVIEETGPASNRSWLTWRQVFLLFDLICCCAVLLPIVWSIKHLREASQTDGKAARNVVKLTLFRQYYIVVVSYIYFTRIVVFALKTVTTYNYEWTSDLAEELATLAFYLFTGYKFRPVPHNPYFVLDEEEEEATREAALKDDDFEL